MRPPQIVVLVFLLLVLTGSAILCLPVCAKSGEPTKFLTALFTATSATCVTGLIPVDTGTYWSTFGQVVIILLIQPSSFLRSEGASACGSGWFWRRVSV